MKPNHNLPLGHIDFCQICNSKNLEFITDFGFHAPCDSLLNTRQLNEMERTYPLRLFRCSDCGLVQIDYVVAPEVLFYPEYPYRSGITETLANNLMGIARATAQRLKLTPGKLAIDIGSNDGTILRGFQKEGLRVLGVEPTDIAKIAIASGIPTVQRFFDQEVASDISTQHGKAAVVTAANMFAHVSGLGGLISGVEGLLEDDGLFITESHYLLDLIETVQYDSIYHEHLKYYAMKPIIQLLNYYDFTVVDVERIPNYGGSIRVYAQKGKGRKASRSITELIEEEERKGLYAAKTYERFRTRVLQSRLDLQTLLVEARRSGKKVIGVGCPGRASTLLTYCNIDPDLMAYVAEQSTSLKLGLFMPGKHIPVVDEKIMFAENPEFAVMLSWHYSGPIIKKLREKGLRSKIVLPLPEVKVLTD